MKNTKMTGPHWEKGVKNDQLSFSSFEDRLRLPNVDHFWNPQGMPFGLCPNDCNKVFSNTLLL